MNFDDAEAYCINWGGHLATISNSVENELIDSLLKEGSKYWIGLKTEALGEEAWKWADGKTFDFEYWGENQPTEKDGQDCVHWKKGDMWRDS
jgi:hypothetical protein